MRLAWRETIKKNNVAMYLQRCDVSEDKKEAGSQTGTREELGPEAEGLTDKDRWQTLT